MFKNIPYGLTVVGIIALIVMASPTHAAIFNPHLILTDQEIRQAGAMSYEQIREFLDTKGGLNTCFDVDPIDGLLKNVPQLVSDTAQRYQINPKYILALIQKESSIVETTAPTQKQKDWAAGYALCDGCKKTNPLAVKYKGLAKQIDAGAGWMDQYLDGADWTKSKLQPGLTKTISGTKVTPANLTTAALYSYTPHIHGNRLLWSIWQRWFDKGLGLKLPDGSLVRNEKNGAVAIIQNGKLRPIVSPAVLASRYAERNIIELNDYDFSGLEQTTLGRPVKFADLSLVKTEGGVIWLLVGERRRRIASPEAFTKIGFNPEEVEDAMLADIEEYAEGAPITAETAALPVGELIQDMKTGGVYWSESGIKHPIWDKSVLIANFGRRAIKPMTAAALEKLTLGDPVKLNDGSLVRLKDNPGVFVISNGLRRPITSEEAFIAFGYDWKYVIVTTPRVLDLHPLGAPLTIDNSPTEPIIISDSATPQISG